MVFLLLSYDTTGLRNGKRGSGLWVPTRHLVRCMVFKHGVTWRWSQLCWQCVSIFRGDEDAYAIGVLMLCF